MHWTRSLLIAALLLAPASLAGCTGRGADETVQAGGNTSPPAVQTPTATAHFQVTDLAILNHAGQPAPLYEDDAKAIVRYTIRQPADAAATETAFVTYLFGGRIVNVEQVKLAPGEAKAYERTVLDLRTNGTIRVEVRAASSSAKAEADVVAWPRAAQNTLELGPMSIRADYGFMERDGRVLVNLTLEHVGPAQEFDDFRVKMLCVDETGAVDPTNSVDIDAPTLGNMTGIDVLLDDCPGKQRYGLEFKARGADADLVGRLLFVPDGWRPTPAA